ncbi:siphovirus ReqiPepy6 Gp37-like family protein [Streptomyces sp. URMC 129]|uniref:siphovirus ReqiPepy6 Gp37-like family protein n=1 Tax=Streptomyces sp. URMC 129 TaxID=3423407 RepID=UPI003F1DA101
MSITLMTTGPNLAFDADPLDGWRELDCVQRLNQVGTGEVDLPATPEVFAQLQPGRRMVIIRDGAVWMSGPLEQPVEYDWETASAGRVRAVWADDFARLTGYITYPNPALAPSSVSQPEYRTYTATNAELIMRDLVNTQCGPGARTERRIPGLALGALAGVGTARTWRTRWQPLGDALREVATFDGLAFRVRQSGTTLLFEVYAPADRTKVARFSEALGNLRSVSYQRQAPTVTTAIVAGEGEGVDRVVVSVTDAATETEWYRVERFVDQSAPDDAEGELTQAGQAATAEGAQTVSVATETVDTPDLRAGRDYQLGDLVTLALPGGVEVAEVVREIRLTASADGGEQVTSVIGSQTATSEHASVRMIRELQSRLARLQAR